jgi:hypothetical protein
MKKINFLTLCLTALMVVFASCTNGNINSKMNGPAKYFDVLSSGNYHLKSKMTAEGMDVAMEMYMKDGNWSMLSKVGEYTNKMILKDNKVHIIDDLSRTILITKATPANQDMKIDTKGMTLTGTGNAEFDGKNLPYEEYTNETGNKTHFFLNGDKLVGIRTFVDEKPIDLIILEMDENIPGDVFDIPDDYQKMEF